MKTSTPACRGNMKPAEIKPLVMAARKAFDIQSRAGLTDNGETFDSWRHRQCLEAIGKPGITACDHHDFQPLLAHFQTLAGDDDRAFASLLKSGQPTDHAAPGDTYEARRTIARDIAQRLLNHSALATSTIDQLVAISAQEWYGSHSDPYPGPCPAWLSGILSRKASIDAGGKGPISTGYLIYIVRAKTKRPDLNLGKDWESGLVDRCTVIQLDQIRSTIVNRINALEGLGHRSTRNKTQRSRPARDAG
jgi:hypothetical protein